MGREALIQSVFKSFIKDLITSLEPFDLEGSIDVLDALKDYLKGVYNHEEAVPEFNYEGNPFGEDEFLDKRLLMKHRDKMVPFLKCSLHYYFSKDEYKQSILFKKLNIQEPPFTEDEYNDYVFLLFQKLQSAKRKLMLLPPGTPKVGKPETKELIESVGDEETQGYKAKNKEYSRSRQVLLFFYLMKLLDITRLRCDMLRIAELGHVLFYWPVDSVKNASVYEKFCAAPLIQKSDAANLNDLEYVKRQFENVNFPEGINLVQKEIDSLKISIRQKNNRNSG